MIGLGAVEKYRKNYKQALVYQRQAFETASASENMIDAARALIAQAEVMAILGDKGMAVEYYKKAKPLAAQIGANKELKDIYSGLSDVYSSGSRYDSAFKYLELRGYIKDTLFNIAADKRLTVLRLDFELEKKESQITQLTTVNDLNAKIIARQKTIRLPYIRQV